MNTGYNPYRVAGTDSILSNITMPKSGGGFFNNRLFKLSTYVRNYEAIAIKNAKGVHANEDLNEIIDGGNSYSLFSRKINAIMQERQSIAALNQEYKMKLPILQEYATKVEIRDMVSKLANEIIVYSKDKKFCEIKDLGEKYSDDIKNKLKSIFENVYTYSGFADGSLAYDVCRDWLVEGYICREIIYDKKGKNIEGFQKLDPSSVIPVTDPVTGVKVWVQNIQSNDMNKRVLLDAEIIYISYSGSSNYMETSYIEPMIRPYNELKNLERSKILFNIINATMHKVFTLPTNGLSPAQAEQEVAQVIADYKDLITFDDSTGLIFLDGSKDLPYSKEYWLPESTDGGKPSMEIVEPAGHDLNENSMLIWFYNNFKRSTKFPFTRLDNTTGGGNVYSFNADVSHDDYYFNQFIERLRAIFKDILLKPITLQLLIDFPELQEKNELFNDLDIEYYGHSEMIKAKELANLQAKSAIASDLQNNFKRDDDKPALHWKFIWKNVMEFTDEQMIENDGYFQEDAAAGITASGAGGAGGGGTEAGGGGTPEGGAPEGTTEPGTEETTLPEGDNTETPAPEGGDTEAPPAV